jgi:hypothetical protein
MKFPSKEFIEEFKKTPGAISVCESISIYWLGTQVPEGGYYVEVGSNAGKASMSAAHGINRDDIFIMVDPIYNLKNREAFTHSVQGIPENIPWGYVFEPDFNDKVKKRIESVSKMSAKLEGDYSTNVFKAHSGYAYVFIDSDDHQPELVMEEVKLLEDKMIPHGIIAFHDFRNQYHGPYEGYQYLLSTGKYEAIDIPWEDIRTYVTENNLEEGNDSWHMPDDKLPCFVGALKRK